MPKVRILPPQPITLDAKLCLELGAAIMFDMPIIALVVRGRPLPEHLRRVANWVVEVDDIGSDAASDAMARAIANLGGH